MVDFGDIAVAGAVAVGVSVLASRVGSSETVTVVERRIQSDGTSAMTTDPPEPTVNVGDVATVGEQDGSYVDMSRDTQGSTNTAGRADTAPRNVHTDVNDDPFASSEEELIDDTSGGGTGGGTAAGLDELTRL